MPVLRLMAVDAVTTPDAESLRPTIRLVALTPLDSANDGTALRREPVFAPSRVLMLRESGAPLEAQSSGLEEWNLGAGNGRAARLRRDAPSQQRGSARARSIPGAVAPLHALHDYARDRSCTSPALFRFAAPPRW